MNVNSSAAGPDAKAGFHPEARYEFKVHLDGATVENLTYRITFDEPDQAGEQAIRLHILTGAEAPDDTATGEPLAEGRGPAAPTWGTRRPTPTPTASASPNSSRAWSPRTGTSLDPVGYGQAVAQRLLPDLLPYRTGTPANYGFLAFNGRTLACNAPEAMFSLILNRATTAGLTAARNANARSDRFPYVIPSS